ncbi:MAG: hypothetical protein M1822_008428 [Bathelium mastoideum]|nr:MAG: hypothetical protein M1822_008428 [Bathelium mastoideum]
MSSLFPSAATTLGTNRAFHTALSSSRYAYRRLMQRAGHFRDRRRSASPTSRIAPSLLLHLPFPEQRLRFLYGIKAKLGPLHVIPPFQTALRELQQDIEDLEAVVQDSYPRSPNRRLPEERQVRRPEGEELTRDTMSGALPADARPPPPRPERTPLVRNKASVEALREDIRGHLIATANHRDAEPKLSQIWRKGPRAFINDIIRREVGRRLLDGEEIRILDKDTIAFLDEELRNTSLQREDGPSEQRRRPNRYGSSRPREVGRARSRPRDSPIQRTDSTSSSSASTPNRRSSAPSAPSTRRAVLDGPTSIDACNRQRVSNHGRNETMHIRYGTGLIQPQRSETDSPTSGYRTTDASHDLPVSSTLRRRAQDHISPMRGVDADIRNRRSHINSVAPTNEARSTVASTRNLPAWTEAADSATGLSVSDDDEGTGQEDGDASRRGRPKQKKRVKVTESERRKFYQLGRRQT